VSTLLMKTRHATIGCETCHGPRAHHTEDPSVTQGALPDARICIGCHEANPARPQGFRQVASKEHSGGETCNTCHQPHTPKVGG
jgi:predicted CXXCH cytochrome family protein